MYSVVLLHLGAPKVATEASTAKRRRSSSLTPLADALASEPFPEEALQLRGGIEPMYDVANGLLGPCLLALRHLAARPALLEGQAALQPRSCRACRRRGAPPAVL